MIKLKQNKEISPESAVIISTMLYSLLCAFFLLTYLPVWKGLVAAWYGADEYSHGFLIIPISIFIVYRKKEILKDIQIRPSNLGLVISILALVIYMIASLAEVVTLASLSMVLFLIGVTIYLFGFEICKELLFAFFLLLFMIPVPAQIYANLTIPLQLLVSKISVFMAQLINIPVLRQGNVIHLPDHTLQVVQACSGLRSMISLLTLSAVFGYMTLKSNFLRSILFLSGVPTAIIVNIIRVILTITVIYFFNYDLSSGSVHTVFGVVIFLLAIVLIALMKGFISLWDSSAKPE